MTADLEVVAELVTVQFPWGSLLRGLLDADPRVEVRPATWADVVAAHSSWGKRLGAGR